MNCKEVSLALDDRDIGALNETERSQFDEHLATCPDCAHDWELHQRLVAGAVPEMPAGMPTQVRGMVAARSPGRTGRTPVRLALLGAVLALSAAATMLVMRNADQPISPLAAAQPMPSTMPVGGGAHSNVDGPLPALPTANSSVASTGAVDEPAVRQQAPDYTVRLLPLQNRASDVVTGAAADLFYATLLDELRNAYGIALIHPYSTDVAPHVAVDCEITVRTEGMRGGKFEASVSYLPKGAGKLCSPGGAVMKAIDIAPNCGVSELSSCNDPASTAVALTRTLLMVAGAPVDPLQRPRSLARLSDLKLDPRVRLKLLQELVGYMEGGIRAAGYTKRLELDPIIIRAAIDLGVNSTDAAIRAKTWRAMRAVRVPPALTNPLIAAAQRDLDDGVRLEAVATLVADFADDTAASQALAAIASNDSRPVIRALAQRNVTGEALWRNFIVASLKDRGMPASERAAALYFQAKETGPGGLKDLFDEEEAVNALAEVVPAVSATIGQSAGDVGIFLLHLGVITRPAIVEQRGITGIFLDGLDGAEFGLKQLLLGWLAPRIGDPRVRMALEKIASDDGEQPMLRQRAVEALKAKPQSPTR
jgi:hypothetical protein